MSVNKGYRICEVCDDVITEGYMVLGLYNNEYYCSEFCLSDIYTEEEIYLMEWDQELIWTEWGDKHE